MLIMILTEMMMVLALMMERMDSIVMMSMTSRSIVITTTQILTEAVEKYFLRRAKAIDFDQSSLLIGHLLRGCIGPASVNKKNKKN